MKKKMNKLLIAILIAAYLPLQTFANDTSCNHQWSDWFTVTEPTCGTNGEESRYCYECEAEEYSDIPATGEHDWGDWEITRSATITKTGTKQRECWECQKIQTKEIPKLKPFAKFSKTTVKLTVSKTAKLKVNYAKGDSVKKWKSSNKKIVTVTQSGKIKGKKKGTAKITVQMKSGKKATCTVKVSKASTKKTSAAKKGGTVYWTPNGQVYHSTKDCPSLGRSKIIRSGSLSNCPKSRGCKICY